MIPINIRHLLEKVKSGDCSQEEFQEFHDWLSKPGNEDQASEYFDRIWSETFAKKQPKLDTDQEKLWDSILQKATSSKKKQTKHFTVHKREKRSFPTWTKIAAVLVPLLVIILFWTVKHELGNSAIAQVKPTKTIIAPKGMKKQITLPDGSKIKLNSGSKVTFDEDFISGEDRIVHLEGEAFFEVTKLKGQRFKVKTKNSVITVLGTSFSVNNYPFSNKGYVAVLTGKVDVRSQKEKVLLLPGEMTILGSKKLEKQTFNPDEIFLWKDGVLYYHNATLDQVFQKLEFWYGVEFLIQGKKSSRTGFSGRFKEESLENILEGLAFSAGFKFDIKDKKVNIHFK
ncbi:FecR domain-containing protein [Flammeovirgaceae bacterium SG7u.111]|nr:FecR domain-containing protein [Flammeovirgaceae bacterium SG7u.132]WPO33731.1 FecR domain-containing protein [Flammeovirgaceae bacterium SG7u.111]